MGFPIIAVGACFYYIRELSKQQNLDKDKFFEVISASSSNNESLAYAINELSSSISMQNKVIDGLRDDIHDIKTKLGVHND
ncbi:hypothetical protein AN644_00205 [Candidatus Epulonipiscium fishelsonii]|nr:hypothetical protein AN644_00205 [Epulopiscium sp. SCG-C06WGA-EpuloA1]